MLKTVVVIPALNEAGSIGQVLSHIPAVFRENVIVADNGSVDKTAEIAKKQGAIVVHAHRRGYGSACLAGIERARALNPDIYIFLDADYSDFPEDMTSLVQQLLDQKLDLIIGSRTRGLAEPGSLLPQAIFGNWLSTRLLGWRYGYQFSDLGPFRAIRAEALEKIGMRDPDFGWTMEMQIKCLRHRLRVGEIPVRYRKRVGKSKITGTLKGTIAAGVKILWTLARYSSPLTIEKMPMRPKNLSTDVLTTRVE
jgi:cellulose synthase/poly-beta-1,6-N-acetylglucosamine synthase-like glycosyltransferase